MVQLSTIRPTKWKTCCLMPIYLRSATKEIRDQLWWCNMEEDSEKETRQMIKISPKCWPCAAMSSWKSTIVLLANTTLSRTQNSKNSTQWKTSKQPYDMLERMQKGCVSILKRSLPVVPVLALPPLYSLLMLKKLKKMMATVVIPASLPTPMASSQSQVRSRNKSCAKKLTQCLSDCRIDNGIDETDDVGTFDG